MADAAHVVVEVIVPVQLFHAERKQLFVLGLELAPQLLHVVVVETPAVRAEVRQNAGEGMHLSLIHISWVIKKK